jgi:formylglycine-generating enzyme required for sulfatase activity
MAVQFNLSWNYSWRMSSGPSNWDAMWVFMKFKKNGGNWQHASLMDTGHTAPAGSTIGIGLKAPGSTFNIASNPGLGAFIYRSSDGFGPNTFNGIKLIWNYSQDGVSQGDSLLTQMHVIHMVYVPSGGFYIGDNQTSSASFKQQSSSSPLQLTSEAAITVYDNSSSYALGGSFSKGYDDFYIMRHEITQEQWRNFFNSLPTTGNSRTNHDITSSSGKNSDNVVNRNNMSWDSSSLANTASTPDRDSPNSMNYCGVSANYLSWDDLAAYLDWAGLRPMTELEYEKAARGTLAVVNGEYAWGSTNATNASGVTNGGQVSEVASNLGANVNWSGGVSGPLRGGNFASLNYGSASRENAGSSYYGALELSANLWERVVTVGNSDGQAFTGAHGDGALDSDGRANVTNWPNPTTAAGSGLRGGSWNAASTAARVSDRSSAATTDTSRGADYGGRGVRSAP